MRFTKISAIASALLIGAAFPAAAADNHSHSHGHNHSHTHSGHGHHHHHTAPHGGTLVVFGDEAAHLELVLNAAAGELTGYVLDAEAEKSIRIKQPNIALEISGGDAKTSFSLSLGAVQNALTGEKIGDTSEFSAKSDKLKNLKRFNVIIKEITIRGVNFKNVKSPFPEGNHP